MLEFFWEKKSNHLLLIKFWLMFCDGETMNRETIRNYLVLALEKTSPVFSLFLLENLAREEGMWVAGSVIFVNALGVNKLD